MSNEDPGIRPGSFFIYKKYYKEVNDMFIGRTLYILGMLTAALCFIGFMMIVFTSGSGGNELIYTFFGFLNGLMAMGVGELVIDSNHRQKIENPDG